MAISGEATGDRSLSPGEGEWRGSRVPCAQGRRWLPQHKQRQGQDSCLTFTCIAHSQHGTLSRSVILSCCCGKGLSYTCLVEAAVLSGAPVTVGVCEGREGGRAFTRRQPAPDVCRLAPSLSRCRVLNKCVFLCRGNQGRKTKTEKNAMEKRPHSRGATKEKIFSPSRRFYFEEDFLVYLESG